MSQPGITMYAHDSPLGSWRIWQCAPQVRLAPLVAAIWYGEGAVSYARDRILPNGQSQLLINLGPTQYRIEPGPPERRVPFRDVWYAGLQQGAIDTEAPHGNALLGVAFHPQGGFPWLGPAVQEVGEAVLPLEDVIGSGVLALRERLLNTPGVEARFALVQQWILARMDGVPAVHPAVLWSLRQLAAADGNCTVAALAQQTGYSRKHLLDLFQRQVGMRPKVLARVLRFRGAMVRLQGGQQGWAELARASGYYDQAHMANEFSAIAGMSPGEFARQAQPDGQSIVLK